MPTLNLRFSRPWHAGAFEALQQHALRSCEIARQFNVSRREVGGMFNSFRTLSQRTNLFSIRRSYMGYSIRLEAVQSTPTQVTGLPHNLAYLADLIDPELTFGCEFEFAANVSRDVMYNKMQEAGFSVHQSDGCHSSDHSIWSIQHDGSVRRSPNYTYTMEIATPILKGLEGITQLFKFLTLAGQIGRVNTSCGGHVHHGSFGNDAVVAERIFNLYKNHEPLFDKLVNLNRVRNRFCRSLVDMSFRHISREKFYKLSFRNFATNGTFENRHHQGCLDFERMINWVVLTQKVIRFAQKQEATLQTASLIDFIYKVTEKMDASFDKAVTYLVSKARAA